MTKSLVIVDARDVRFLSVLLFIHHQLAKNLFGVSISVSK